MLPGAILTVMVRAATFFAADSSTGGTCLAFLALLAFSEIFPMFVFLPLFWQFFPVLLVVTIQGVPGTFA